jgi:preprotein translocase SecF subunit
VGEGDIRSVVSECGIADPMVVRYGDTGASEYLIRFQTGTPEPPATCPLPDGAREKLAARAEEAGEAAEKGELVDRLELALGNALGKLTVERVEFVGPRVGGELREDGLKAIGIACLLILIYITVRFSARFAPGAVIALVHDIAITAGLFVIFGLEFDLRVLAALLAILGYSLNDTIIIYDRIRETMELRTKYDLEDVLNQSVNQTLSRTLLTSGTTLVAVVALLLLGGEVIRPFALAMTIGIVVGTYSSVFVAAPTLLVLERWLGEASGGAAGGGSARAARRAREASGPVGPA